MHQNQSYQLKKVKFSKRKTHAIILTLSNTKPMKTFFFVLIPCPVKEDFRCCLQNLQGPKLK